ncbi:MAG: thioredoxin domain-containing protein [Turneriella sp.]|nr:thioredoxin domain-containing protein [Turneriella sp.]
MEKRSLVLPYVLIFAGALLGLIFSAVLIYEHNGSKTSLGSAVCDTSDTSSCEKAKESSFGKIMGLPLALYGFVFYGGIVALGVFLVLALNDTAIRLLFWGGVTAFAFDIFLLLYSLTVLGGICRLCAVTYVGGALIAAGAVMISRRGATMIKAEVIPVSAKAAFSLILAATVALGFFFHNNALSSATPVAAGATPEEQKLREQLHNEFYKQWKAAEKAGLDVPKSGSKGGANPVLTIVEFADPLCPHCKDMGHVLGDFVKKNPDKVRVVFRHYPLDIQCNDAMKRPFHVGACDLARAIECGEAQGKFWPMHDAVFAQQESFMRNPVTDKAIESLAQSGGLNPAGLLQCFKNQSTMAKVKSDIAAGNRIKITGTPTVLVNDRRLPGVPLEYISGILEKILSEESKR